MESIIFPSIIPTKVMKIAFLYFTFFNIFTNKKVPPNAKMKETTIFCNVVAEVNNSMETSIPSFAESTVAAVVGDTNLFLLSCCIIRPTMLIATPAIMILNNLGIRLNSTI
ncbi:hypothetical protein SDC9_193642 [bioreactor metagenome]|uniref:Uncharacterized protein n=1 Tax=bioreactor metagenome TaxID=1076179 RepID=A0A645I5K6_9ZZZZ